MGVLLVALFEDAAGARAGLDALATLHAGGTVSVYAAASIASAARRDGRRSATGSDGTARGGKGASMGSMAASPALAVALGALRSLNAGPLALAMSTVPSALIGTLRDLDEAGVDAALLEHAARHLGSSGGGVLAEVLEERAMQLDASVLALGGRVVRCHLERAAAAEERLLREIAAIRAELRDDRAREMAASTEAAIDAKARRLRESALRGASERAIALARALRREAAAKVSVLRRQASQVPEARRLAIAERAALERGALEARVGQLIRATERAFPSDAPAGAHGGRGPA